MIDSPLKQIERSEEKLLSLEKLAVALYDIKVIITDIKTRIYGAVRRSQESEGIKNPNHSDGNSLPNADYPFTAWNLAKVKHI